MKRQPAPASTRWTIKSYPPARTMNAALHQRFEGLDIEGNSIAGVIWHVGAHDKNGDPATYVVHLDPNGHNGRTAVISAETVREHMYGLGLISSIEADNE